MRVSLQFQDHVMIFINGQHRRKVHSQLNIHSQDTVHASKPGSPKRITSNSKTNRRRKGPIAQRKKYKKPNKVRPSQYYDNSKNSAGQEGALVRSLISSQRPAAAASS